MFVKRQPAGLKKLNISMEAVPYGYGLALVALPLAALGGPGDFAWHAAYGFENQIDAPFSPTHQMLFLAGGLLGGIGLASTWHRPGRVLPLSKLWPAVISATAVLAMVSFTFMNLLPWFWTMVPTGDVPGQPADVQGRVRPGRRRLGQARRRASTTPRSTTAATSSPTTCSRTWRRSAAC